MRARLAALIWLAMPVAAWSQTTTTGSAGCTVITQAAVDGATARYQANDTALTAPKSVTSLSCLDGFFNGTGLDVISNFLNPTNLLKAVEGQICAAVNTAWQEDPWIGPMRPQHQRLQHGFWRHRRQWPHVPEAQLRWRRTAAGWSQHRVQGR